VGVNVAFSYIYCLSEKWSVLTFLCFGITRVHEIGGPVLNRE
jgi:hypothetical protein